MNSTIYWDDPSGIRHGSVNGSNQLPFTGTTTSNSLYGKLDASARPIAAKMLTKHNLKIENLLILDSLV